MVTIKDGCGCDPCGCDWKQKLKEAYSRAIQSVNKIGDNDGSVYFPDGTGFVKLPLLTKEQIVSIAEIDGIKASVDSLNVTVPALETQVAGVTGSLVSDVKVLNGTTAGKFKVRIGREKAAPIDSNDYDLGKVNSIELIQGSGPAMVKAQLTLSDGTVLRSDDFLFTSESIGTDVYISSFTFKNGNVDGTISADIGLNNGVTIEANNFHVPTDPNIISSISDLDTRISAIEGDSGLNGLKAAVANLQVNKADVDNVNQSIRTGGINVYSFNLPTGTPSAVNPDSCAIGINESESGKLDTNKPLKAIRSYYDDFAGDYTSEPLGNVALLNDDGSPKNFTSGGKTLYTGSIRDLITVSQNVISISKEITILFQQYYNRKYYYTSLTIPTGTFTPETIFDTRFTSSGEVRATVIIAETGDVTIQVGGTPTTIQYTSYPMGTINDIAYAIFV